MIASIRSTVEVLREQKRASWVYRQRYGQLRGFLFWRRRQMATRMTRAGDRYPLRVPGIKHPIQIRSGTSDENVVTQIFIGGDVDFELGFQPRFIVDAGANIGLTSIVMATRYPEATIVAIEVDDSNYAVLVENCRPYSNVICIKKALWHTSGYVKITNPHAASWEFQVDATTAGDPDAIPTLTIDEIEQMVGADELSLVKIDIEGAEREVLGAESCDWLAHTRVLAVELHDRLRAGCTNALERAIAPYEHALETHGEYSIVRFSRK